MKDKKVIAIIPARGGSKRLPRKNILKLNGVPLLTRVIKTVKKTKIFDEIIVSSEDKEILLIAKNAGASAYFRPLHLAKDRATVAQTCTDVLLNNNSNLFCCIYSTAVLIKEKTLKQSFLKFLSDNNTNVLMGVSKYNYHPVQALKIMKNGSAKLLNNYYEKKQSHTYPQTRVSNGTFYWGKSSQFLKERTFYSKKLKTFDVPEKEVCDVDTLDDYQKLQKKFRYFTYD